MKIKNKGRKKYWLSNKRTDGLGKEAIQFAEKWADFLEEEMAKGQKLEKIAEKCREKAAIAVPIMSYQLQFAVIYLSEVWEHGERLCRWHNLKYQVRKEGVRANKEGRVLDPFIFQI